MAENDVQLDLKKRARRRLVGAVALALLAAIVLPMVMDSEPAPGTQELSIRIPSQEGGNYASRLITGAAPAPASPVLPAQSASLAKPVQIDPVAEPSASAVPETPAQSAPKPEAKAPVEAQRARDILEGRSESSSSAARSAEAKPADTKPAASGKIFVQLGVFGDETNARKVVSRAAEAGVKVSIEKLADGKSRVRAGPYADRASADKVVEKLKKAGLNGIVTSK